MEGLYKNVTRVCGDIPTVVAGNKADVSGREKLPSNRFQRKKTLRHIELSVRSGRNIEQPLLFLAKTLTGDNRLRFEPLHAKSNPKLKPKDNKAYVAKCSSRSSLEIRSSNKEAEVAEAAALSLPPSKDDDGGL